MSLPRRDEGKGKGAPVANQECSVQNDNKKKNKKSTRLEVKHIDKKRSVTGERKERKHGDQMLRGGGRLA